MLTADAMTHIFHDEKGVAWIDETNVKVVEVVRDYLAHAWTPEEMHLHLPHLSLAQIHAALAFFHDHREELHAEIETRQAQAEAWRAEVEDGTLRRRLSALRTAKA